MAPIDKLKEFPDVVGFKQTAVCGTGHGGEIIDDLHVNISEQLSTECNETRWM